MSKVIAALARYGGILAAPRRTAQGLSPDEGHHDGVVLAALCMFATGSYAILEGIAGLYALRNLGAVVMLLAALGRLLIAPVVVLVAAETLLGKDRSYRRGVALVPMLLVMAVAHELRVHGVEIAAFVPEIVGGVAGVALAWWIRPSVPAVPVPRGEGA